MKRKLCGLLLILALIICTNGCKRTVSIDLPDDTTSESQKEYPEFIEPSNNHIEVWAPQDKYDEIKKCVEEFLKLDVMYSEFEITVEEYSVSEATEAMIEDVELGGDLYFYMLSDQERLIEIGGLYRYENKYFNRLTQDLDENVIDAILYEGELYGCPVDTENSEQIQMIGVRPQTEQTRALVCIDLMEYIAKEMDVR